MNRASRRGHTALSDPGTFEPRPRNPPGRQAIQLILPPPRSAQSYILAAATSYAVLAIGGMTWHCIATDPEQVIQLYVCPYLRAFQSHMAGLMLRLDQSPRALAPPFHQGPNQTLSAERAQ